MTTDPDLAPVRDRYAATVATGDTLEPGDLIASWRRMQDGWSWSVRYSADDAMTFGPTSKAPEPGTVEDRDVFRGREAFDRRAAARLVQVTREAVTTPAGDTVATRSIRAADGSALTGAALEAAIDLFADDCLAGSRQVDTVGRGGDRATLADALAFAALLRLGLSKRRAARTVIRWADEFGAPTRNTRAAELVRRCAAGHRLTVDERATLDTAQDVVETRWERWRGRI